MSRAVGEGRLGGALLVGEVLEPARERMVNDVNCGIGRILNVLGEEARGMGLLALELELLDEVTGVDEDEDDEEGEGGMASTMRLVIGSAV